MKLRILSVVMIMLTVAAVCTATMLSSSAEVSKRIRSDMPERSYTSIHIQEGDTLEMIASQYNDARYCSDEEYIETIKMINNMDHEQLHPGCYLVVMDF